MSNDDLNGTNKITSNYNQFLKTIESNILKDKNKQNEILKKIQEMYYILFI